MQNAGMHFARNVSANRYSGDVFGLPDDRVAGNPWQKPVSVADFPNVFFAPSVTRTAAGIEVKHAEKYFSNKTNYFFKLGRDGFLKLQAG
jgi:hypothetical protein